MREDIFNVDTALLTNRCVVRRFREGDGLAFFNLLDHNRAHLEEHFPGLIEGLRDPADVEGFVRRQISEWLLQREFTFAIWHNKDSSLIGYIHYFNIDWDTPKAEISYFIDREHIQQGLMTEVLARTIRFGFLQLKLEKVYLHMLSDNYSSQRLARRIGFQREGELRNEFKRLGGQLVDLIRFGFARETYGE